MSEDDKPQRKVSSSSATLSVVSEDVSEKKPQGARTSSENYSRKKSLSFATERKSIEIHDDEALPSVPETAENQETLSTNQPVLNADQEALSEQSQIPVDDNQEISQESHQVLQDQEISQDIQQVSPDQEVSQDFQQVSPDQEVSQDFQQVSPDQEISQDFQQVSPDQEISQESQLVSQDQDIPQESHMVSSEGQEIPDPQYLEIPYENQEASIDNQQVLHEDQQTFSEQSQIPTDINQEASQPSHRASQDQETNQVSQWVSQDQEIFEPSHLASHDHEISQPSDQVSHAQEVLYEVHETPQPNHELMENRKTSLKEASLEQQAAHDNVGQLPEEVQEAAQEHTETEPHSIAGNAKLFESLNKPQELESQYAHLLGEPEPVDLTIQEDPGEFPLELSEAPLGVLPEFEPSQYPVEEQIQPGEQNEEMQATFMEPEEPLVELSHHESHLQDNVPSIRSSITLNQFPEILHEDLLHDRNEDHYLDQHQDLRQDQQDPFGAFEITPEDIFNEIKVARTDNKEHENSKNLHSFIISKTFSSENVVVLLNLRRLEDGEWVLDKTIAQGLKPQTYGGVVSIDQYDFVDPPPQQPAEPIEPPSTRSIKQMPSKKSEGTEPEAPEPLNANNRNIMDVLKKLEDYVADVNREIQAARELVKNSSQCADGAAAPVEDSNDNENNDDSCELSQFDELPFIDKLVKMFGVLTAEEDMPCCNLCDNVPTSTQSQSAISYWLRSVMKDIATYCPAMLLPKTLNDLRDISTASSALISQSQAIFEEVKKTGLLKQLSASGLLSIKNSSTDTKSGVNDEIDTTPPKSIKSSWKWSKDQVSRSSDSFNNGQIVSPSEEPVPPDETADVPPLAEAPLTKEEIPPLLVPDSTGGTIEDLLSLASLSNVEAPPPAISEVKEEVPLKSTPSKEKFVSLSMEQIATLKVPLIKEEIDSSMEPSVAGSLQINIESKSDLDEFVKEHEKQE